MQGLSYFRHKSDAHKNWKFQKLRARYGWAGEAKFYALNGIIAETPGGSIDLSRDTEKNMLLHELEFGNDSELFDFLRFLQSNCDLLSIKDKHVTTWIIEEQKEKIDKRKSINQEYYVRRRGGAVQLPMRVPPAIDPDKQKEREERDKDKKERAARMEYKFNEWWAKFPKRVDRKRCYKKFMIVVRDDESMADVLIENLQRQLKEREELEKKDGWAPFWKSPLVWLNGENWNDEPLPFISKRNGTYRDQKHQGRVSTEGTADEEV